MTIIAQQRTIARASSVRKMWLPLAISFYIAIGAVSDPYLYLRNLIGFATIALPFLFGAALVALVCSQLRVLTPATVRTLIPIHASNLLLVSASTCLFIASFWTLKVDFPRIMPFYADPMLAELDAALHGADPWTWAHQAIAPEFMPIMLVIYFPIWLLVFHAGLFVAAVHPNPKLRKKYMVSFFATYCLFGTLLAIALSSVGPIFYDKFIPGDRFGPLTNALKLNTSSVTIFHFADRLLDSYRYGVNDLFAGISAMPSVHVAVATLNALLLGSISTILGIFGWTFVILTFIGSVYFGWHYALDGYASVLGVTLIWWWSGRLQAWGM